MNTGICLLAYIPIRKEPTGASEMVSQLLFGETYKIMQTNSDWSLIKCIYDGYNGWISNNIVVILNEIEASKLQQASTYVQPNAFNLVKSKNDSLVYCISAGSSLYNLKDGFFEIFGKEFQILQQFGKLLDSQNKLETTINTAIGLINVPYLWGGRSFFGIDCSGLVQIAFKVAGVKLPRDAWQQAEKGELVNHISNAKPGDVAFFENANGKIIHTGIILAENKIIHASGKVRVDRMNEQGIINSETLIQSHKLATIRRFSI